MSAERPVPGIERTLFTGISAGDICSFYVLEVSQMTPCGTARSAELQTSGRKMTSKTKKRRLKKELEEGEKLTPRHLCVMTCAQAVLQFLRVGIFLSQVARR
jgi:hypothetical protein